MAFGHEGFAGPELDLNERLIRHPAATFFMRRGADILIVDRALDPKPGDLVVAVAEGALKLCRVEAGKPIEVWGVVTYVIQEVKGQRARGEGMEYFSEETPTTPSPLAP